jgi:hypothetical protein
MQIKEISCDVLVATHFQSGYKAMLLKDLRHFNQSKINNNKLRHGLPLVYYSAEDLSKKFTFLKANTIQKYLKELTKDGILFSTVCNHKKYDKTKSYLVNFAYYDALSNGIEYSITDKEKFTKLCGEIVKNTEIDCKVLKIDIMIKSQRTVIESQRTVIESQRTVIESQPIPTNITPNKTSNTFSKLINLKTLKSDKTVLAENTKNTVFSKEQLKVIDYVKSIFKYYRITTHKDCNQDIALLIGYLQNELENHDANFILDRKPTITNIYDLMENLIVEIWGRIKESETKKQNFKFFDTCIRNEYKTEMIDQYLCKQQQQNKK